MRSRDDGGPRKQPRKHACLLVRVVNRLRMIEVAQQRTGRRARLRIGAMLGKVTQRAAPA